MWSIFAQTSEMCYIFKLTQCARYMFNLHKCDRNLLKLLKEYEHVFRLPKYVEHLLKPGYYHSATTLLHTSSVFFIPIFTKEFRMISNKSVGGDGLITFWKNPLLEFHTIFTTNCHVVFKIFWEQNYYFKVGWKAISKWDSFDNFLFQIGASVISKRGRDSYFKVVQSLFQSGEITSKWSSYFKVRQLFQSGA